MEVGSNEWIDDQVKKGRVQPGYAKSIKAKRRWYRRLLHYLWRLSKKVLAALSRKLSWAVGAMIATTAGLIVNEMWPALWPWFKGLL